MKDHDLLMRIDERVGYIAKMMDIQDMEIESLKTWRNRTAGALTVIAGAMGYCFVF